MRWKWFENLFILVSKSGEMWRATFINKGAKVINTSRECVFCCTETLLKNNKLLYQDARVVAIEDWHPRATHHYLVLSRQHIRNVDDLTTKDITILEHMLSIGKDLLKATGYDIASDQINLGFHRPPFASIQHLHLHCLGLPYIPTWNKFRFQPNILQSYVNANDVIETLKNKQENEKATFS